jgi:hypothetical protein
MEPVSPVVPGTEQFEVTYAKDQPEYIPLPVLRTNGALLTRWRLTDEERKHIAEGGDLFVCVLHFGGALQPLKPIADTPENAMRIMIETESAV